MLKFDILRVPSIQIPTKKGLNLCFVKQTSPMNTFDGTFANYIEVQKKEKNTQNFEILHTKGTSHTISD
jgi:hypothetical protein